MTAYTVTATQSVNPSGGMLLLCQVVNNGTMAGTPATGTSTTAYNCSVTTTQAGSYVFGAIANLNNDGAFTAEGNTTITQFADNVDQASYAAFRSTSGTVTPGATVFGSTTTFATYYGACGVEVLPNGTISIDASSPAVVDSTSLTALTTASFTPPGGTLLVAQVATDGSGGAITMAVTSSPSLTWTERVSVSSSVGGAFGSISVWTAAIPGAAAAGRSLVVPQAVKRSYFY